MGFLILAFLSFTAASTFAEDAPQEINRQELFTRAYKSLSFFLFMANADKNFADSLTNDEKGMLSSIFQITSQMDIGNWLNKNKIQRFGGKPPYTYKYLITKDRTVELRTMYDKVMQIQFSNDQAFFTLDPAQPVRSARVLDKNLDSDIYYNLSKINSPTDDIDLARALSMLTHEVGHKLNEHEIPDAVNSLAAKFEGYVRSLTNTTEIDSQKISFIKFKDVPFYDHWIENTLYGEYLGVNIPARVHQLSVFDGQGIYAWVEDQNKITDLTEALTAQFHKSNLVQVIEDFGLQMAMHNVMVSSDLTVSVTSNKDFKFAVNAILYQVAIPFFNEASNQSSNRYSYNSIFRGDSHVDEFFNKELTIDRQSYQIKKVVLLPLTYTSPEYKIEFLGKKPRGKDLELFFSIKGKTIMTVNKYVRNAPLWPELTLQIGNNTLKLKANRYYEDSEEYGFLLSDIEKISNNDVRVTGLQMRLKEQNISVQHTDVVKKTFLPSEVTLFKSSSSEAANPNIAPKLKSLQLWNGREWVSVRNKGDVPEGSTLRFVFFANEKLRTLAFIQNYYVNVERWVDAFGKSSDPFKFQETRQRQIELDESNLRQTQDHGLLYVDVIIDHKLQTKLFDKYVVEIPDEKPTLPVDVRMGIQEKEHMNVDDLRHITDISFVTASGLHNQLTLKTDLSFKKAEVEQMASTTKVKAFKKMKCEILFN